MRYRGVLGEKLRKLEGYKAAGIVGPNDAFIIAVSQGAIIDSDMHDTEVPSLVRAVFPVGETAMIIKPYSGARSP